MARLSSLLSRVDWLLVLPPLLLSLFGLAVIGSLGLAHDPPTFSPVIKQSIALALGIGVAIACTTVNYRALDHYARAMYLIAVILLVLVLIFGKTINGTRGWFIVGGWGFQPVEFAKAALALILARFMRQHANVRTFSALSAAAIPTAILVFLVLLQPDFGSAMILCGMFALFAVIAGVRRAHVLVAIGLIVVVATAGWFGFLQDYQKERIRIFLDPGRAPLTRGYNIRQATIAIGAGGFFGRGLGFGSQSQLRFIPEAQTDFIFAVIGEELGFVAVLALFGLFALFFFRVYTLARRASDNFSLFLAVGLSSQVFLALVVNAGMNLGLLPVTGIALPFLSAGGSSLMMCWLTVGILQSIQIRTEGAKIPMMPDASGVAISL